jgi:exosome complex component CSL4
MFVLPGQRLAEWTEEMLLGVGIYEREGSIFASLAGEVKKTAEGVWFIEQDSQLRPYTQVIPAIGQTILGQVVKLNSKYAGVDIWSIEGSGQRFMESVKGTIRLQDIVSAEEREVPSIQNAFRPGDLIRARVIGVGDPSAGLLLSTGVEAKLGVIYGKSAAAGAPLLPAAWNEMTCSRTGLKEKRKCAKPE